jgi:hypothetical protein
MSVSSPRIRELTILESGDALSEPLHERLSRAEFERRYQARPDIQKAELIEGVVYVASPVVVSRHGQPHIVLLGTGISYFRKMERQFADVI